MYLSNFQRVKLLCSSLISQPSYTLPYFSSNLSISQRSPLSQNLPWWSFAAIEFADSHFPGRRIFEWGSGGSTLRYAKMGAFITAIEHDPMWLDAVSKALDAAGCLSNCTLVFSPFNFENPADFKSSEYLNNLNDSSWDVVVIDGQDNTFNERLTCFHHAEPFMKPGSCILVDDFWRYEVLLKSNRAQSVKVYQSVGPCRIGVTSTAVFHY